MSKKDFNKLKYIPEIGDAVLIHDDRPNIVGDSIEWFTNGKVSHVDLYVGNGKVIGATIKGVVEQKIKKYFKRYYTITIRRIKNITVNQAVKMKLAAYSDVKKKIQYDFFSYLGYIFLQLLRKLGLKEAESWDNPVDDQDKVVCSSAYDRWAKKAGIDLFPDIGEEAVTPRHIFESDRLETIIEV